MKKFFYLLIVSCFFILTTVDSIAQPQPFAAGEVVINPAPIGAEPCGSQHRYEIIAKFYRDCGGGQSVFPDELTVYARNQALIRANRNDKFGIGFRNDIVLTPLGGIGERGEIDNECIRGNPICTAGRWYRGYVFLEESEGRWEIFLGEVREGPTAPNRARDVRARGDLIHTPENLNIRPGQRYNVKSEIRVECKIETTGGSDIPPNVSVQNSIYNNRTAELVTEDLVQTFCNGQEYAFQLPIVDNDNPPLDLNLNGVIEPGETLGRDSLHFQLTSVMSGEASALYENGFSSTAPIPLAPGTKFNISKDGFVTFKPQLRPNERSFFGVVTYRVSEYRRRIYKDSLKLQGGGTKDSLVVRWDPEPIAVTNRQFRFVIDITCNRNLPEFTRDSLHWNDIEQAWEFGCATDEFIFDLSFPMYEHSLKRGGLDNDDNLDLRIIRGNDPLTPLSDDAEPIFDIIPIDQTDRELLLGEFSKFKIVTKIPLGPGKYSFFFKLGSDKNTLINRCGFEVEEFTSIPVYINPDQFEYEYFDRGDTINICYPQVPGIQFFPLVGQPSNLKKKGLLYQFRYHYTQNRPLPNPPAVEWDTTFINYYAGVKSKENTYTDSIEVDEFGDPILKIGTWRIELGLIFPYEFQDSIYRGEVCFDHDDVIVDVFQNKSVNPRNWDLCPDESWPVIDLDSMTNLYNAQDYLWGYETKKEESGIFECIGVETPDTLIFPCLSSFYKVGLEILDTVQSFVDGRPQWTLTVRGTRHLRDENGVPLLDTIPVGGSGNPQFPLSAVAFGNNGRFLIESIVQLENAECYDTSYFVIRKGEVEVYIGEDSTICPGQQYTLTNERSYFTPDSITYEWLLNDEILVGEDTNFLRITEEGDYVLNVYKRSELDKTGQQVVCVGSDTVTITIADVLVPPVPECSKVTFKDDSVRQTFFWPEVKGAEDYQVKFIVPSPSGQRDTSIWLTPNGEYNQLHLTAGREVELMVRGVNLEVPENSICRYGPVSFAAAPCEVVVKPVNIFTPNGDGINDVLRFDLLEIYIGNKLQVFNRWGELVHEDTDYLNDWDGGDLKDGTYFYILHVGDDKNTILRGNVTIVR